MPTARTLPSTVPAVEPVTLAQALFHLSLEQSLLTSTDPTDVAQRQYVALLLEAARHLCEQETGGFYAGEQTVELTYTLDEPYRLPAGAVPTAVRGFFTALVDLAGWSWTEYVKGASVNRTLPLSESAQLTYTVTAGLPATTAAQCPGPVKLAILELTGEWFRNRETSSGAGAVPRQLPVSYGVKLAPYDTRPKLL